MNWERGYNPASEANFDAADFAENFWNKTVGMEQRLGADINQKKYFEEPLEPTEPPKFKGRHLIGRDRPILGGVYVGAGGREAIVVDEKYGELLPIYEQLLQEREEAVNNGGEFKKGLLRNVWELTMRNIPYDSAVVADIAKDHQGETDWKEALDSYIIREGGVCRHQALLAGYLLEKLGSEGKVQGKVSIDRNYIPGMGGHAWVRYTNSKGEVFIIDPAQEYIGRLEGEGNKSRWFYERPEDLRKKS